jgi:hypothetical protein
MAAPGRANGDLGTEDTQFRRFLRQLSRNFHFTRNESGFRWESEAALFFEFDTLSRRDTLAPRLLGRDDFS